MVSATLTLGGTGCSDDGVAPPPGTPAATIENIWPNEDGRSWSYSNLTRGWEFTFFDSTFIYPDSTDVPPAPDLDDLFDLIDDPPLPDTFETMASEYRLTFNGETTTLSGVTAQNLESEIVLPAPAAEAPSPRTNRFMVLLAAARPDLGLRLQSPWIPGDLAPADTIFEPVPADPLFLHGGAWEKTEEWIGTYGDIDTLLAWKFLETELSPGHEFTFQLVPSLANNVFLHARVRRLTSVQTPVGTFEKALELVYMVDFGLSIFSTVFQPDNVFMRMITYGNVIYAPTAGPVMSYERFLVPVGETLGDGAGDTTLELIGIQAGNP
jgi:hypothetical protein